MAPVDFIHLLEASLFFNCFIYLAEMLMITLVSALVTGFAGSTTIFFFPKALLFSVCVFADCKDF